MTERDTATAEFPHILEHPVAFAERAFELCAGDLDGAQNPEVEAWLSAQWQALRDLLDPVAYSLVIRPYNGRPRALQRAVQVSADVSVSQWNSSPVIELNYGQGHMGVSPENKGSHMIHAVFHPDDTGESFRGLTIDDCFVVIDDKDRANVRQHKFQVTLAPTFQAEVLNDSVLFSAPH